MNKEKEYIADIRLGVETDTLDLTGKVVKTLDVPEINNDKISGYVVTIDDMTSLILAEKHAAWSNIAKKIAHEVKNPLTPIKLSAERIEKKVGNSDLSSNEISILAQTISKQVDAIGKLVDEFSSFARMPKADMKIDNFSEKSVSARFLFSTNFRPKTKKNTKRQ